MTWFNASFFRMAVPLALAVQLGSASASVVMSTTRVIYPGNAQQQNIQLTSQDDSPSVIQAWIDSGNPDSTPQTADAPFVITPPVFRIEPKTGQTVRIVFTGKNLPQDRESVFYLNTLQIPSMNAAYANQNQMLVMLRNRLKVFYRPAGIEGSAQKAPEQLSFRIATNGGSTGKWRVTVSNTSGYYISLIEGSVVNGSNVTSFKPTMIAPRSEEIWNAQAAGSANGAPLSVKVKYIDDYGATRDAEYPVTLETGKN
jgi:fimbrial chaperone protein